MIPQGWINRPEVPHDLALTEGEPAPAFPHVRIEALRQRLDQIQDIERLGGSAHLRDAGDLSVERFARHAVEGAAVHEHGADGVC